MNRKLFTYVLFLLFSFSWINVSYAEDNAKEEKIEKKEEKKALVFRDELKRDTPQGAIKGLMDAAKNRDYEKVAKFLDLKYMYYNQDSKESAELARKLKVVIDQNSCLPFCWK